MRCYKVIGFTGNSKWICLESMKECKDPHKSNCVRIPVGRFKDRPLTKKEREDTCTRCGQVILLYEPYQEDDKGNTTHIYPERYCRKREK